MNRLLVLACSKHKRTGKKILPAIERYDGPMFRLLRRYLSQTVVKPQVYVLSAEYGLIHGEQHIPNYDCPMTLQRAQALRPLVAPVFRRILADKVCDGSIRRDVFLNLGRKYHEAVGDAYEWMSHEHNVTCATGSLGSRLTHMHAWLYGAQSLQQACTPSRVRQGSVKLRGVEIALNADQVIEVAHAAILSGRIGANASGLTWYVTVGERQVGPKWLVSQVTGLPVGSFHTDEARRVLQQIGIDVRLNIKP